MSQGFIRNGAFEPNNWIVLGVKYEESLKGELVSNLTKVYVSRNRKVKSKIIDDVVEALIGVFLVTSGEEPMLKFLGRL